MTLEVKAFDEIDEVDLQASVSTASPERRIIDYKAHLPGGTDKERKEFLFDVSSFANAAGGHLVYGMTEQGGVPTGVPGIQLPDPEAEILRLENMARDGADPRIMGLQWRAVPLSNGMHAIVGRIPNSWVGPHMVTFKGTSKFYSRNSSGKYQLDVREIRALFSASAQVEEGIRAFRNDRLGALLGHSVPTPVSGPKAVMHVVPLDAMTYESRGRAEQLFNDDWLMANHKHVAPMVQAFRQGRFITVDGLVCYAVDENDAVVGFSHVFLSGAVESVTGGNFHRDSSSQRSAGYLRAFDFEEDILLRLDHFLEAQRSLGIDPPLVISMTLLEVQGYEWIAENVGQRHPTHPFDRDTILLPDVLINEWPTDSAAMMRPVFDSIANAAGWPRSPFFNTKGEWGRYANQ